MSQIETIMLVTLGFAVAALIALFLGRMVWSYALGLGKRRMQRSAPASMAELQADRDRLRAEYAMLARKLELRLDDLKTRLAEQTAEVSRNRNRIDQLLSEVAKRDGILSEREEEITQLRQGVSPLETELASRTQTSQQLKEQLRDRDEEIAKLRSNLDVLREEVIERERQIEALRGEVVNLPTSMMMAPDAVSSHDRLQERIDELTTLSQQIESQRQSLSQQHSEFQALQDEISQTRKKSTSKKPGRKTRSRKKPAATIADGDVAEAVADQRMNVIDSETRNLERQLLDAEQETQDLQSELKKLDDTWNTKLEELGIDGGCGAKPAEPSKAAPGDGKRKGKKANGKAEKEPVAADSDAEKPDPVAEDAAASAANGAGDKDDKPEKPAGKSGFQNVISLAARIRALQKNAGNN